jgi:hypothetical protein
MPTDVHQLDDGAWISVDNSREVNVSDLWRLVDHDVCDCETADFLAEGFVEVGVDGRAIEARIAGQCIVCGQGGVTGWLTVGVSDPAGDTFYSVATDGIHTPGFYSETENP